MNEAIEIYDTTLRDGGQGLGVNLSLLDKLELTRKLDWLGVAYIEGGWPGSNPKDAAYFAEVKSLRLKRVKIAAFGSTRHAKHAPEDDPNLRELVNAQADACCIFGKSWDLHVREALRVSLEENLEMIASSVEYLRKVTGKPVLFDAEHFFDGYTENREYALRCVQAAAGAGASRIVLCDTNGGMLPEGITQAVTEVKTMLEAAFPGGVPLGIHVHNDGGLAVANTLAAVQAGCTQVQGTINGIGERCGNVDLTTVIANLELKLKRRALPEGRVSRLTDVSRFVWERLNLVAPLNQAYVGKSAFAHKGGVHVSAMQRNERTYEHVTPESVGNTRQILISELSGRSNVLAKLSTRYPELSETPTLSAILTEIQTRENEGYSYEAADASFELLVKRKLGEWQPVFELGYYRVHGIGAAVQESHTVEATVKLSVKGEQQLCAAEGNGPVDALSHALLNALRRAYPELQGLQLVDFKVRVVNSADGTAAKVRVLIEHTFGGRRFATLGVSENVIAASWQALADAVEYAIRCDDAPNSERPSEAQPAVETGRLLV